MSCAARSCHASERGSCGTKQNASRQSLVFLLRSLPVRSSCLRLRKNFPRCRPCYRTRVHRPDVRMPGIDGIELLRRLKSLKASRPVIVHFRHADVPLAIEAMKPRPCRRRRYLRPGSLAIVEFLRIDAAQRKSEYRSATGVWRDGNLPPVRFDNSAGNREANPHATSFRRGEGLE
jgi:hypothetical protein